MPRISAGLLMYRIHAGEIQVLLIHPGGPFWRKKDEGAWSVPKGELHPGEAPFDAARREFEEETGVVPRGPYIELIPVRQKAGKIVAAWAFEGDCDASGIRSNMMKLPWPPRSGQYITVPEVDRAEWFSLPEAARRINPAQTRFLEELEAHLLQRRRG